MHPSRHGRGRHTRCTCTDSLGVVALAEETVDTTNGERETSFSRSRLGAFASCSFSTRFSARHDLGFRVEECGWIKWVVLVLFTTKSSVRGVGWKSRETNVTVGGVDGIYIIDQSI